MNILYIGNKIDKITSGADAINQRNQLLFEMNNLNVDYYPLPRNLSIISKLTFGITNSYIKIIFSKLISKKYTHVFVSHSLYGRITQKIKSKFPDIVIVGFFHNIESYYAKEFRKVNGIKKIPFQILTNFWERKYSRSIDKSIVLNERDAKLLEKIYQRKPNLILPTSFKDSFIETNIINTISDKEIIDYLFVGVNFFGNIQGIQWFIDNVLPKIPGKLYIIGKGMDKVNWNNLSQRIVVKGYVEDLSYYYLRSKIVISPIFYGGGMKTKTAEALMYGKIILGTKEAFEGYEIDPKFMYQCNTAKDFINRILTNRNPIFNIDSRNHFLKNYSIEKDIHRFRAIFNENEFNTYLA